MHLFSMPTLLALTVQCLFYQNSLNQVLPKFINAKVFGFTALGFVIYLCLVGICGFFSAVLCWLDVSVPVEFLYGLQF